MRHCHRTWTRLSTPTLVDGQWVVEITSLKNTGPKTTKTFETREQAMDWVRLPWVRFPNQGLQTFAKDSGLAISLGTAIIRHSIN